MSENIILYFGKITIEVGDLVRTSISEQELLDSYYSRHKNYCVKKTGTSMMIGRYFVLTNDKKEDKKVNYISFAGGYFKKINKCLLIERVF